MMQYLKQAQELAKELKAGTIDSDQLAEKLKAAIPPQFLAELKKETPESVIAKITPLVSTFMGKDAVAVLGEESTLELFTKAMDILKA